MLRSVELEKQRSYDEHSVSSPLLGSARSEDGDGPERLGGARRSRKRFFLIALALLAPFAGLWAWERGPLRRKGLVPFATWLEDSPQLGDDVFPPPDAVCNFCDCSVDPPGLLQDHYRGPLRSRDHLSTYIRRQILAGYCRRIFMTPSASYALINSRRRPEELVSWNLTGLQLGLPTAYLFTKTHPTSKTGARRGDYLRRHTAAITRFREDRLREGYEDGTRAEDKQLVYIVVEDSPFIQTDIVGALAESGVPYIYFAHGPTREYGNAQHNAAVALIHSLSDPAMQAFGHGPVLSMDDDSEIHEDLLHYIWRVKRFGAWQMGNLGPSSWEGPLWDEEGEKIVAWPAYLAYRNWPIDAGAFTYNTSLLGTTVQGPEYWADVNGGETEFLDKILISRDDIEPICNGCRLSWHNQPLEVSVLWLRGHPDPLPPYPTAGYDDMGELLPGWHLVEEDMPPERDEEE